MSENVSEGTTPPSLREPFVYVLNRMENAAQSENPYIAGYPSARAAVLAYVGKLAAELDTARAALAAKDTDLTRAFNLGTEREQKVLELRAALREAQEDTKRLARLETLAQSLRTRAVIGIVAGHHGGNPCYTILGFDDTEAVDEYSEAESLREAIDRAAASEKP